MSTILPTSAISPKEAYGFWAGSYDSEPNPMLALERRFLETLLPDIASADVVDLGCGTGRWLVSLIEDKPRSLLGIDSSPEMLRVAREKVGKCATLLNLDCESLSLPTASADLILCSFLLSYIENAGAFFRKIHSILRADGCAFVSDVHPETVKQFSWRRGVRTNDGFRDIRTFARGIDEIISCCLAEDLEADLQIQAKFAAPEGSIFEAAGKGEYFEQIKTHPAIYVLRLKPRRSAVRAESGDSGIRFLRNARLALGARTAEFAELQYQGPRTTSITDSKRTQVGGAGGESATDLDGFLLLPGLINAHDHLEFALFPRLGHGTYNNFQEWATDIHQPEASPVREQRKVPRETRLWWGGIRNLLCGVTTVCHHNPYEAEVFDNDFVVRVVREYGWAHSLVLDRSVAEKKFRTPQGWPFLLHLGEGTDENSQREIFTLNDRGALDRNTVLIHGLGLDENGRNLLRSTGAGLVWCPSSNYFLFGTTLSLSDLETFPLVALGSDSPLTAQGDLLDEVRFARECTGAAHEQLYSQVGVKAAELLRLRNGQGTLRIGAPADFVAVRDRGLTPAETLSSLSYRDVELVLVGGRVHLASPEMMRRLPQSASRGLQPLAVEDSIRWIRAPLERLFADAVAHLGETIFLGGKRIRLGN